VRIVRLRLWAGLFALVSAMAVSMHGTVFAEIKEEARWSIDFGDISISEALDQLTKVTGIKIVTKVPLSQRISPKRYRNQSIEQILKDLLKNVNFAAVWHYSENGIESIGILAFERQRVESRSPVSNASKMGTIGRSLPRISGPRKLPTGAQMSGSQREEGVAEEPPAEPEETEVSEADDRDEELEKSSSEGASNPGSADTDTETAASSSSGEEGLSKDQ
jgi:hypothetical protein